MPKNKQKIGQKWRENEKYYEKCVTLRFGSGTNWAKWVAGRLHTVHTRPLHTEPVSSKNSRSKEEMLMNGWEAQARNKHGEIYLICIFCSF